MSLRERIALWLALIAYAVGAGPLIDRVPRDAWGDGHDDD